MAKKLSFNGQAVLLELDDWCWVTVRASLGNERGLGWAIRHEWAAVERAGEQA